MMYDQGFSRTYPGFTTVTARDIKDGYAVRLPGRERYVGEVEKVTRTGVSVDILWADGTETRGIHGNTDVQIQIG